MTKPVSTATFVMICIVALVAAYGFGYCFVEEPNNFNKQGGY